MSETPVSSQYENSFGVLWNESCSFQTCRANFTNSLILPRAGEAGPHGHAVASNGIEQLEISFCKGTFPYPVSNSICPMVQVRSFQVNFGASPRSTVLKEKDIVETSSTDPTTLLYLICPFWTSPLSILAQLLGEALNLAPVGQCRTLHQCSLYLRCHKCAS